MTWSDGDVGDGWEEGARMWGSSGVGRPRPSGGDQCANHDVMRSSSQQIN